MPGGGPSRLTYRRLRVFIDHLPPESATKTAVRDAIPEQELAAMAAKATDGGHGSWSHLELLVARVSDLLEWVVYAIYASQGGKPDKPKPMARPGVVSNERRLSPAGLDHLQRLRQQGGS